MSHIDLLDDSVWEGISAEAQIDFLRCGEEMVKSTLSLAGGADFRALTTMGMFGAVGVAIFAAVATIISGSHPSWSMTIGGTIAAIGLLFASGLCAAAAWQRNFFVTGFEPQELLNSSARLDQYRARVLYCCGSRSYQL